MVFAGGLTDNHTNLINKCIEEGLSDANCASEWAEEQFGLTALHPAGKDENGFSKNKL
jgi:hypothetical protein